jgi:hypothetical protein
MLWPTVKADLARRCASPPEAAKPETAPEDGSERKLSPDGHPVERGLDLMGTALGGRLEKECLVTFTSRAVGVVWVELHHWSPYEWDGPSLRSTCSSTMRGIP